MLKAAVIGVGAMGCHHARVYNELEDVELAAVVDANRETAQRVARLWSVPAYDSYEQMLAEVRPDLVSVATPTGLHHKTALQAIDCGIHVLVEKPIAATLGEAREMNERAQQQGVVLSIGHIERFNPAVVELKRRLEAGELGTLYQLHARRLSPYPARIQDAGVVLDLAIHELDIMTCLDVSPVERIFAETRYHIHPQRADMLSGLLRFSSGTIGLLDINWLTPTKIRTLSVTGERGMFVVNYLHQDLIFYENGSVHDSGWGILEILGVGEGNMVSYRIQKEEPLKREIQAFVQAIGQGDPAPVTGEEGLRALRLALMLHESAKIGQSVCSDS
jgi:UDP-N-acetylglucosamine 3-dehydrogenase